MDAELTTNESDTPSEGCPTKIKAALKILLEASGYATDVGRDSWDFAVEIKRLLGVGLSASDLRWLVCRGYVEHGREVTPRGDDRRQFRSTGELTFCRRTCFVLTRAGLAFARDVMDGKTTLQHEPSTVRVDEAQGKAALGLRPHWDPERQELRLGDRIVKKFRSPAVNQETILTVFEEDGWPPRIDDPLPPAPEQDPKRRLHDTIKCLNRNQQNELVRFHGDGTGKGVVWELVDVWHEKD
jgi:hypothetical protein